MKFILANKMELLSLYVNKQKTENYEEKLFSIFCGR